MMHAIIPIPPVHATTVSSAVMLWGTIEILVALVLVGTALWIVGRRYTARRQSQMKETVQQYEAPQQPLYEKQPEVSSPKEEVYSPREEVLLGR